MLKKKKEVLLKSPLESTVILHERVSSQNLEGILIFVLLSW
jgi:hypothetical protein